MANETEAPTSGKTSTIFDMAALLKTNLDEEEFDFVNIVHQHYVTHGEFLTPVGLEKYGISEYDYKRLIAKPKVLTAIRQREVPIKEAIEGAAEWRKNALSAEQIMAANFMLDLNDTRSDKKKLQDLGISTQQWNAWMREPAFAEYLENNVSHLIKTSAHEADVALLDKVKAGDLASIKYFHEYTNKYVSRANQPAGTTVNVGLDGDAARLRAILSDVIEIIVDEVDDGAVGARIGDRIKALAAKYAMLDGFETGPIDTGARDVIVPEIKPVRELTTEMLRQADVQ